MAAAAGMPVVMTTSKVVTTRCVRWPLLLAVAFAWLPTAAAFELRGGSRRTTEIVGRQLLVDGQPLHLKGVNWNPVPKGGVHPKDLDFRGFVEADSELMSFAGINAVRTYETITDKDVLDVLWKKNIYVLNTVYIYGGIPVDSLVEKVLKVRDHPAILMWVVGNEWNYNGLYVGLPFPEALARVKDAVKLIKSHDPNHPVATIHGEMPSPETIEALSDVDAWGINKYSGLSFGDLFDAWAKVSTKPIFLGEYGADAYNSKVSDVDEAAQAKALTVLTGEIVDSSSVRLGGVCIGGLVFELADEWWKDGSGNPREHDAGGVSPGGGPYPDMTFNEEWWGLLQYDGRPREAFTAYANTPIPGQSSANLMDVASCPAYASPLRMNACGAHAACKGQLGDCCPGVNGEMHDCCTSSATTTEAASVTEAPRTTWRPPKETTIAPGPGHKSIVYEEQPGKFANDPFEVGTDGCNGVGECQFMTRQDAQSFCDTKPDCTIVLMHPFSGYCAGGLGCYTPRKGSVFGNSLWDRSGGKAWVKTSADTGGAGGGSGGGDVQPANREYVFIGFHKAAEAHDACRKFGRLASPKTVAEQKSLQVAVDAAEAAGKLSKQWPANTIWLGGQWNSASEQWEWDDGTAIEEFNWADGQPSAHKQQDTEPWLCMVLDGHMHDSDPPYEFGVMCETDGKLPEGAAAGAPSPPPPPPEPVTLAPTPPPPAPVAPAPVAAPGSRTTVTVHDGLQGPQGASVSGGHYWFAGFNQATAARQACGATGQLAMPKSEDEIDAAKQAINRALADGKMESTWPKNIIWLGGQYNIASQRWEWDDGSAITNLHWGLGQPSGEGHQGNKPWLGMHSDGAFLDSDALNTFGVMCELKSIAPEGDAGGLASQPCCTYKFAGFTTAAQAPNMCKQTGGRLAMPKSTQEQEDVHQAIHDAIDDGHMTESWPKNTAWLGGQWQEGEWLWNDGTSVTEVNWAQGQPSSSNNQAKEPYLCMVTEGVIHDSDPPYNFAAICEYGVRHDPGELVCTIDAPLWLRLVAVIAAACLVVAGLRRWQGPMTWSDFSAWDVTSWDHMYTQCDAVMQLPLRDRILLLPVALVFATFVGSLLLGPCLFPLSLPAILSLVTGLVLVRVMISRDSLRCPQILDSVLPSMAGIFPAVLYDRSEPTSPSNGSTARSSSPLARHRGASGLG